ncbi:hypothetical protein PPYR_12358 [Photinus pyralis]|uniref:DUF3668 domain-containing protein n=2 Tax=Photinus pyralis TaxID=7054 RepID=A0A5N4ADZ7_PHOPY|nr:centrosomal protein of 120 kDa-like [Photinus pyralis]KAB0795519.1 hypothetical protein PPYR_12358 [Photinus pyralis]
MEELNGKCVSVVLAIDKGRNMSFLEHPVKIVANFHGRPLESDLVSPDDDLCFNTELVWEIEKKELRKVRTRNIPLKVELQLVENNRFKDRVGFILLSTRSANIIPHSFQGEIPFKWCKLLGVQAEHKRNHPELYMSLTIRDLNSEGSEVPYLSELTLHASDSQTEEPFYFNGELITFQYLPDGYIQIGNGEGIQKFLLTIKIKVAYNLNLLLPEVSLLNQNREKYFMSFTMLGITIKSKPFSRDLHDSIEMNEKIVVRIRSDCEVIRQYLSECCQIYVTFYQEDDKLGIAKVNVDTLLGSISETDFRSGGCSALLEEKCFFTFPYVQGTIPTDPDDKQPCIEVVTTLKQEDGPSDLSIGNSVACVAELSVSSGSSGDQVSEVSLTAPAKEESSESLMVYECHNARGDDQIEEKLEQGTHQCVTAAGDQQDLVEFTETVGSTQTANSICVSHGSTPFLVAQSETTIADSPYQQYCLDVIVDNISLKKCTKAKTIRIKFKHPKASSTITVDIQPDSPLGEDIILENAKCKMFFISTEDHVRKMVYAWPPKLLLTDELDNNLTEELDIYTALFLAKKRYDCSYITECKATRTYESLANVSIRMYLQEYGLSVFPDPTDYLLSPPILDEHIAIQELGDLQTWKVKQKAQYTADLKLMQRQRLAALQDEWTEKKNQMESNLAKSVQKFKTLTSELQTAMNTLRTKKALEQKEEEMTLTQNYNLQDLVEKNTLKYSESTKVALMSAISNLEYENKKLKHIIDDQRVEIEQIKKTALTKEQSTTLLQQLRGLEEKFEDTQKAKTYFKDQLKKAVREIHDLKSENQKQIKERIHSQRIELSQLRLDDLLSDRFQ